MKIFVLTLCCLSLTNTMASGLPDWAEQAYEETKDLPAPENADVWVLLDEIRIKLKRDGRHQMTRRVVKRVLSVAGKHAAIYKVSGNAESTRIKKMRGWHQDRKGKTERLEKDNILAINTFETISQDLTTMAYFDNVARGSLLAFESNELVDTYFTRYPLMVLSDSPVRSQIIEVEGNRDGEAVLELMGFEGWQLDYHLEGNRLVLKRLPAIENEVMMPDFLNPYPRVLVGFRNGKDDPLESWDHLARWYYNRFEKTAWAQIEETPQAADASNLIEQAFTQTRNRISYRQVYLSPSRGWEPLPADDVERLAYGDCKDMASYMGGCLRRRGVKTYPALATIGGGMRLIEDDLPQSSFDHVIVAVQLAESLGLSAEVVIGDERYLLLDPTDSYTPLGSLSPAYEGRQVMICTPEGARWVAIPKSALATHWIALDFEGQLDSGNTFTGTLSIEEHGNAWGLTGMTKDHTGGLEDTVRELLGITGAALLISENHQQNELGNQEYRFQLQWPHFLMPDLGEYRLNPGRMGGNVLPLAQRGKPRFNPVYVAENPGIIYRFRIASERALAPGLKQSSYEDAQGSYQWQARGGNTLDLTFTIDTKPIWFPRDRLDEAQTWWSKRRKAWNSFMIEGPVFREVDAATL